MQNITYFIKFDKKYMIDATFVKVQNLFMIKRKPYCVVYIKYDK